MANDGWVDVDEGWTDIKDEWIDVESKKSTKLSISDILPHNVLTTGFKAGLSNLTTPISKIITGKSIGERTDLLNKKSAELVRESTKPISTTEAFFKQLPAATSQALINFFDLTPLDIGIMGATAGIGKIPVSGTTVGEVAKTIPIGKGFGKNVSEFGRYEQTLKEITPLSSRGVTASTKVPEVTPAVPKISTGEEVSNLNLTKYAPDVQEGMKKLINSNPGILKRKVISHTELDAMAQQLDNTPIVKKILSLPEGQMAAEMLKLRKGQDAIVRVALDSDLRKLEVNLKNALQIRQTQSVGRIGTETGRALEQFKMPIEAQTDLAKIINDKILQIRKDPTIKGEELDRLISGLVDLRKTVLSKEFNPSWFDKGYEFWMNNILSGPWTHTVNVTSNTLFGSVIKQVEKATAVPFDFLLSKVTGKREHFLSEIPEQIKGFARGLSGEKLPTGVAQGSKLEYRTGLIKGVKGKVIRIPTSALVLEDNFAKRLGGWSELMGRAEATARQEGLKGVALINRKNQLIGNPTEKLIEEVSKEQLYRTFQDSTGLGELIKGVPQQFFRWIMPFRNTLASIVTKGYERTPAGFIKVVVKGAKAGINKIPYPQKEVASDLGNAATGTALMAGVMYSYLKGNITGSAPKDKAKRDVFYKQGKQPYSILIGDKYVPFSRLEPWGTAAMQMVDFVQGYKDSDKDIPIGKATDAVMKLTYSFANKTFLSGITNFVNALVSPEEYGEQFISQYTSSFVPFSGAIRNVRQITDTTIREPKGIGERIANQVPGLSSTVPAKISSFGEVIEKKPIGITKYAPFPITRQESNVVADELSRLDMSISYPSKNLRDLITGTNKKLTREEYNQLLVRKGGIATNTLQRLIMTDYYSRLPDNLKEKLVQSVISQIGQVASDELRIKKSNPSEEWVDVTL
jgi:hypothetical protein